jgi:tRNA pseudouridine(55) synthase
MEANPQPVITIYKKKGETPYEALMRLRLARPEYAALPLSYAGRLDPMAEGVLIVLVGEENKYREKYLDLEKTYKVQILFGIGTDTYDVLGKVIDVKNIPISETEVRQAIKKYSGIFSQPYPPYSSKPVLGKPLFEWARAGKLQEIQIPEHDVEVFSCEVSTFFEINASDILNQVAKDIRLVTGDFRQGEILATWHTALTNSAQKFMVAECTITASSGTYMRGIADALGKDLLSKAIAFSIIRTRVGRHSIDECLKL